MFFSQLIGNESQKISLLRAVREGRVSHAYLFYGLDGVGKKLFAFEFAKALNCLRPLEQASEPCLCQSCRKIEKSIHPDVFLVKSQGSRDIKIDQIRQEVEERVALRPFEGRFKVAIVDQAERMNPNAQNAFLKTLEEPPPDSVIILVSSKPESLLATIRSRCQPVEFGALAERDIVREVAKRGALGEEEIKIAAKLSGGSLAKALALDAGALSSRREIILKLSGINPNRASDVIGLAEFLLKQGEEDADSLEFIFEVVAMWLRDLLLLKIGFGTEDLSNEDLAGVCQRVAEKWTRRNILDKIEALEAVRYAVFRANANKQIALQNLLLKIAG
ncbi:MAG: DNA polymerase III subunit delta' [Deltaproteobacteria bacterium]